MAPLIALCAVAGGLYCIWRLVRDYFVASPFDNISGPASGSLWAGTLCCFTLCKSIIAHTGVGWTGNILQLFARDNWDFVRDVVETYGPVAKLQLFLGVSVFLLSIVPPLIQLPSSDEMAPCI